MPRSAPPPLTGRDPARAADLSRKIGDRLRDTKRHYNALVAAMAWFGDDFDAEEFQAAFNSEDPDELNRVKSVERGVDQLYNYAAELAAFGLELAELRGRHDETNARRDLEQLARLGVISMARARRLQRLRELRRLLVHDYATAMAEQVHEAAKILRSELPYFFRAYAAWVKEGFTADRG